MPSLPPDPRATGGEAQPATELIQASHERSALFGLVPHQRPEFDRLATADMNVALERARLLRQHGLPLIEALQEQVAGTESMVVLTDASGTILHAAGDGTFIERARRVALAPGVSWAERTKGTNAIGTALIAGLPTVVHANQHFLTANHFLTCSACPIADPEGNVIGVLDVSGDFRSYHPHTLALVRMSTRMIENQLFIDLFPDAVRVHFHTRHGVVGTLMEAIAVFAPDGCFLAANRIAKALLNLDTAALRTHTFSSLFDSPMSALHERRHAPSEGLFTSHLADGTPVFLKAEQRIVPRWIRPGFVTERASAAIAAQRQADDAHHGRSARLSSLRYLNTGDPQMEAAIAKVQRVVGRDIAIMVIGETGTGKELLARAIHSDSPRAAAPFVAVNCASLPETLIESELFGYEEGAFTGARRRGNPGKILAANGGTLFLDEIGDMPVVLQARLLRVLQERVVSPLGGAKSVPVDLQLICATNRNLRELIARGQFREDLYYRLNGLTVRLPPLRERTDLSRIVEKVLVNERHDHGDEGPLSHVSAEVLALFHRYRWPGNFRQLANVLRSASAHAGPDGEIRLEHLPEELVEEAGVAAPLAAQAAAAVVPPPMAVGPIPAPPIAASPVPAPPMAVAPVPAPPVPALAPDAPAAAAGWQPGQSMDDVETASIRQALNQFHGNVSAAARALGISRNTIYRKLPGLASQSKLPDAGRR
jgi:transcriptional regulator of acetoin/glycerol metabolism